MVMSESSSHATPQTALRTLPRNVWAVTITSFLTDISSEMILNLLPLFLANVLGVRVGVIGLIEGLAETTSSLLKTVSGWVSDRLAERKRLAVLGYGISALAKPFLYLVTSWWGVLGVRFADRVGKGIRTAPRDALLASSTDENHRGLSFGLHRAGDTAGALVGLLIAIGVVWRTQAGALALTRASFQRLVLISIIPAVLAVLVLALASHDVRPEQTGRAALPRLSLRGLSRQLRTFLLIVVIFTLGNSADAFLILRAQERGLSVLGVLAMLATFNLVYAIVSTPAGALSDRVGRHRVIVIGWLVYGLLYLGFAVVDAAWQMWLLYGLYGVYYGATEGTAKALIADLALPEQRGTAYGVYNAAVGITALPASLLAGVLWQGVGSWRGFGPRAPFLFGAALALIATVLLVLWARQYRPSAASPAAQ